MNTETITITPVGGEPVNINVPAYTHESPEEFAGRIFAVCHIHPADLPAIEWSDLEGVVPSIVVKRGDCHLVCYDGDGSVQMPECMAVSVYGTGWALVGTVPPEWGQLSTGLAAAAATQPREGEQVYIERAGRAFDAPEVRVTVVDKEGSLAWGSFAGSKWLMELT